MTAGEKDQTPDLIWLDRRGQRVRPMPPERRALWQEAMTLPPPPVPAEPIDHHRPVNLRVMGGVPKTAAPALEALCVQVRISGAGEVAAQAPQNVLVDLDGAPEGAPARDERL